MIKQLVVGTAGHVDHGKTALIRALTGVEGDQTEEEKRRGITIELSFCNLKEKDTNIAFIDVPGHEKLVKTMISGAFGFDGALIAIDAKEGIKPQTIEHLQILNLLHVKHCVVALTKSDLVSLDQIQNQTLIINEHLKNYPHLQVKGILPVSIYDEKSIQNLKTTLLNLPAVSRPDRGVFRYYVDRSFSLKGVGTVVTGTVLEGSLEVGKKVWVCELAKEAVVRNLQVHGNDVEVAKVGERAAVNLGNLSHHAIKKGTLLTQKGYVRGFDVADVWFECLDNRTISHNIKLIFHAGAKQVEATLLHYEGEEPRAQGFAKIRFSEPLFLTFDEPFILSLSGRTIAGGRVLNPINDPIKKRLKLPLLKALYAKDFTNAFALLSQIHKKGFGLISAYQRFGLSHEDALNIVKSIPKDLFVDEKGLVVYPLSALDTLESIIKEIYTKNSYALLSATSVSIKLIWASPGLAQEVFNRLESQGFVEKKDGVYVKSGIKIEDVGSHVENRIYAILKESHEAPDAPYNIYDQLDIDRKTGDSALKRLTASKKVVRLAHNLFVTTEALTSMMTRLREIIKNEGYVDVKNAKSHFGLTRKYLIAYLDYLDQFDDIIKDGMARKLK
jgi:selenocysteine-specific elongation factor